MKYLLPTVATLALLSCASQTDTPDTVKSTPASPTESFGSTKRIQNANELRTEMIQGGVTTSNSPSSTFFSPNTASTLTLNKNVVDEKPLVKYKRFARAKATEEASKFFLEHSYLLRTNHLWQTLHVENERGITIKIFDVEEFKKRYTFENSSVKPEHMQLAMKQVGMENKEGVKHLEKEYSVLKSLDHPNIVRCYSIFDNNTSSTVSLVMEGNARGSIDRILPEMSLTLRKKILWEVFTAMKYLHSKGIVHREIRLENLILMSDDSIRLIDFDLSVVLPHRSMCLPYEPAMPFIAPEEFFEETCSTIAADLWSFGVLIVEVLGMNGRLKGFNAFVGENHKDHVYRTVEAANNTTYMKGAEDAYMVVNSLLQLDPKARLEAVDEAAIWDLLMGDSSCAKAEHVVSQEQSPSSASPTEVPYESHVKQELAFDQSEGSNSSVQTSYYDNQYYDNQYYDNQYYDNQNYDNQQKLQHHSSENASEVDSSFWMGRSDKSSYAMPYYQKKHTQILPSLIPSRRHRNGSNMSHDYYRYQQQKQPRSTNQKQQARQLYYSSSPQDHSYYTQSNHQRVQQAPSYRNPTPQRPQPQQQGFYQNRRYYD